MDWPHWAVNAHIAYQYVLNTIASYGNLEATKSTPSILFQRRSPCGYDTTVAELDENLIGRGVMQMLMRSEVTSEIRKTALSYLMFLKRKRNGKLKA